VDTLALSFEGLALNCEGARLPALPLLRPFQLSICRKDNWRCAFAETTTTISMRIEMLAHSQETGRATDRPAGSVVSRNFCSLYLWFLLAASAAIFSSRLA